MARAETLAGDKAERIVDRIRDNGALSAPESAPLGFLEREARQLPDELQTLARRRAGGRERKLRGEVRPLTAPSRFG